MTDWNGCCEACGRRDAYMALSQNGESYICIPCEHVERRCAHRRAPLRSPRLTLRRMA
jgi:hypothetical protein